MAEEELEETRKRKVAQARRREEAKEAQEKLKAALRGALESDAYDRLTNIQHVNSQLFLTAAQNIIGLHQRAGRRLRDEEVRAVLARIKELSETKTEIRFARK